MNEACPFKWSMEFKLWKCDFRRIIWIQAEKRNKREKSFLIREEMNNRIRNREMRADRLLENGQAYLKIAALDGERVSIVVKTPEKRGLCFKFFKIHEFETFYWDFSVYAYKKSPLKLINPLIVYPHLWKIVIEVTLRDWLRCHPSLIEQHPSLRRLRILFINQSWHVKRIIVKESVCSDWEGRQGVQHSVWLSVLNEAVWVD